MKIIFENIFKLNGFLLPIAFVLSWPTYAQEQADSIKKASITKKALSEGIKLISTSKNDTVFNEKSVDIYAKYAGMIIRNIQIERIGFEVSIYDSAKKVDKTIKQLSNALHTDTRIKIIRKHLFIHENESLNPFKLADNERYLRDRDFILDSRIVVTSVPGTDSVDLLVVTRDVFSIGATLGGSFPSAPKIGIYDANLDGRGQRLEFTALIDQDRTPKFGYSIFYRKSSLLGSLTNLEVGFTQINSGMSIGEEPEFATLIRLTRPLVSPYSRLAGGLELSRNWSKNVYNEPDSVFLKYSYNIYDGWLGYNFGIRKKITNRTRKFLAARYFDGKFDDKVDDEVALEEKRYNDAFGYLSEFSIYNQNFYKTRYIFGFGRTEDVPSGFNIGVTGGYIRQIEVERPYAAVKFSFGQANKTGNFYNITFQSGGYLREKEFEDVVINSSVSYFTKLLHMNRYKARNLASVKYTQLFNQNTNDWLNINKSLIPGFRTDSLEADQRLAVHLESVLYTPWELLGFRFAPFIAADMVSMQCKSCEQSSDLYWGFSSGIRTRNENLIFGTVEFRVTYIPSDEYGESQIVFGYKQNLRVKSTGTFANKPTLISYN